jgi:hypothetical protein
MAPEVSTPGAAEFADDLDARAERLYGAVVYILKDRNMLGLLTAVGDAEKGVAWNNTSPKTRTVFRTLANLTGSEPSR